MSYQPLRTTELEVGQPNNKISFSNDGSMTFSDRYYTNVRLSDLVGGAGGGSVVYKVEVNTLNWQEYSVDTENDITYWYTDIVYSNIQMPTNDLEKVRTDIKLIISTSPFITEDITIHAIQILEDRIKLISTEKIHCIINIEPL
jgi:hypothetical protein